VERKVYKGFSVGVNPKSINRANEVEVCEWIETSLVDRPKDPDALLIYQSATFDPDALVEVEIIESPTDSPAPPGADPPPGEDPAPAASAPLPAPEPLSRGEEAPSLLPPADEAGIAGQSIVSLLPGPGGALPEPVLSPEPVSLDAANEPSTGTGEGTSFPEGTTPSDEQRAAIVAALRAAGLPEGLAAAVTVTSAETETTTTDSYSANVGQILEERAISTATPNLPVRENLEGKKAKDCRRKDGEMCRGDCTSERCAMPDYERQEGVERVIKHEGGKWCVYSESGKKLGEHDTEAEAKDQLQAIEISKHKDEPGATQPKERAAGLTDERYRERLGIARSGDLRDIPLDEGRAFFHRLREDVVAGKIRPWYEEILAAPPVGDDEPRYMLMRYRDGSLYIRDATLHGFADKAAAEARLAELTADVEPPAPSADTVSSPESGEVVTRLATVEAELTRAQAAHQEALSRLAAVTEERDGLAAEVKRLAALPTDVPPARFTQHSLAREFLSNLGSEGDAHIARLRKEYEDAKAEAAAERDGDRTKRDRAIERMLVASGALAQHGVYLKP
jgi:hypothetical protein